jgi:Undecaprenyl-phosphate galactose phosphotransferase WbaP
VTPRDALKHVYAPFKKPAQPQGYPEQPAVFEAERKLSALKAEIEVGTFEGRSVAKDEGRGRVDPAQALHWFVLSDVAALIVGLVLSWAVAVIANDFLLGRGFDFSPVEAYRLAQFTVIGAGVITWLASKGHYRLRRPFWSEVEQVATACAFAVILDGFFQFAAKVDFSRLWLVVAWVFAGVLMIVFRSLTRRALDRRGLWSVNTLLVGSGATADECRAALRSEPVLGYKVVVQIENLPLLLEQVHHSWDNLCKRFNADYVVIAMDGKELGQAEEALASLSRADIPFSVSPPMSRLPVMGGRTHYFFNYDITLMSPLSSLENPIPRSMKRLMDIVGSGLALLALSPVFLLLPLFIRRDGGRAFYGQERVGLNGKRFMCLKFRSMVMNGDEVLTRLLNENPQARKEWMTTQKLRHDPRITRVGSFIRKWSIDELPQLINVFRGDMSLVGPRPIFPDQAERYKEDIHFYTRVRPGLTGLWQVSGRNDVTFDRRVYMDCWYVRNWSLWHDIAIICKTIPVVLNRTGAY